MYIIFGSLITVGIIGVIYLMVAPTPVPPERIPTKTTVTLYLKDGTTIDRVFEDEEFGDYNWVLDSIYVAQGYIKRSGEQGLFKLADGSYLNKDLVEKVTLLTK